MAFQGLPYENMFKRIAMKDTHYKEEMHARFQLWEREFQKMQSELKAAARETGSENQVAGELESLHAQMQEAWDQLDQYDGSGEAWKSFRDAFDEVWDNLKAVVDNVVRAHRQQNTSRH